jgi:hypothetical protein
VNDRRLGRAVRALIEYSLSDAPAEPDRDPGLPPTLVEALRTWVSDHPNEARQLVEPEPESEAKSPEALDDMVFHIRYEVLKLIGFLRIGNGWLVDIDGVPEGWGMFAAESTLEAALIHTRCVAEFLRHSGQPTDAITARDYVSGWHWAKGEPLKNDLAEIHGRIAHLGLIRRSVQHDDEVFEWGDFLARDAVPILLDGFREFIGRLEPERAEQFNRPKSDEPRIDIAARITVLVGPAGP